MSFFAILERVVLHRHLTAAEAEQAMNLVLEGGATATQLAAFLVALRMKGETADELLGFARAMRGHVVRVESGIPAGRLLDTCGTGGDGAHTVNVSTLAALVAAGAGARVAKHGNRSISSRCGSADVIEGLGVRILTQPAEIGACLRDTGFAFLYAPALHPAMKHAHPARVELKLRTVFNYLGPLTNPAGAGVQLVGSPSPPVAELMAGTLVRLGLERGFVVHGSDGMDEITTTGETVVYEIKSSGVKKKTVVPEDFGVRRAAPGQLRLSAPEDNVKVARETLEGRHGPHRDIVLVNASAALVAAGLAEDFRDGVHVAAESVDSGKAMATLANVIQFTQSLARPV